MQHPRIAARYAKSLIDLATEQGALETVYADMKFLQSLCAASNEFVNILRSPVIKGDKKQQIIAAVTTNKIGKLTTAFNTLLINKGRESDLPEIVNAFIDQYNAIKGIHKVTLTTAVELSETMKKSITDKVSAAANLSQVELHTKVNDALIGGFILEFNNNLVDASILRDLNDIKKTFSQNLYIHNIR